MGSYSQVTQSVSQVIKQVHGLRQEWNVWNDEAPLVQEEEIFHDITDQSTLVVPSNDQSSQQEPIQRSLMDLTPKRGVNTNHTWNDDQSHTTKALCGGICKFRVGYVCP